MIASPGSRPHLHALAPRGRAAMAAPGRGAAETGAPPSESPLILPAQPAPAALVKELVATPNDLLERDLGVFPTPMLQLLGRDHFRIAAISDGETLADTPLSGALDAPGYQSRLHDAEAARAQVLAANPALPTSGDELHDELAARQRGEQVARELVERLPDFKIAVANDPVNLDKLAENRDVEPESRQAWKDSLLALNGLVAGADGNLIAPDRVLVLPYTYYHGQALTEDRLEHDVAISGEEIEQSLGKNFPSERSVVLYAPYLRNENDEVGNYRIALHETGHALDHALERLPGLGSQHRAAVDALFAHDQTELAAGHDRFTSERAHDNVREYFAEGVEAYFTRSLSTDEYRPDNNREQLRQRNPELFAYLDKLMHTDIPVDAIPSAPEPTAVPEGTPQPSFERL